MGEEEGWMVRRRLDGEEQAGAVGGPGETTAMGQHSCHDHEFCPLTR